MADQTQPALARIRLSPSQVYCLAWAARTDDRRPPDEHFGVRKGGWNGGYWDTPRLSRNTWRSLASKGLIHLDSSKVQGVYELTPLGKAWLKYHDLYDKAVEPR